MAVNNDPLFGGWPDCNNEPKLGDSLCELRAPPGATPCYELDLIKTEFESKLGVVRGLVESLHQTMHASRRQGALLADIYFNIGSLESLFNAAMKETERDRENRLPVRYTQIGQDAKERQEGGE